MLNALVLSMVGARRTSRSGAAQFRVDGSAHYAFRIQRIGWRGIVSPWIAISEVDTVEITFRLERAPVRLSPVLIAAQRDSISRLLPFGINPKTLLGRIITPAEVVAKAPSARDYVDIVGSAAVAGLVAITYRDERNREKRCIVSVRSPSKRCAVVYVDNVRTDSESAIDLATPENLDFVVWVNSIDAGVLYGGDAAAGVLHLFTKAYRRSR